MIAYLDMPSGLSGDMMLGCLIDAGWSIDELRAVVASLKLPTIEWAIESRQVLKGPLRALFVDVRAREGHVHRRLADIQQLIDASPLSAWVKKQAIGTFTHLAIAEAKVHGTTPDQIHFHEVGAVDAIIDVVGSVAGLEALHIHQLYAGPVPLGQGWTHAAHGLIPLPAPATLEILASVHAPTRPAPGPGEWVTPTAAALLAQLAIFGQPNLQLQRIGLGAGQRDCDWPNVARLILGQPLDANSHTPQTMGKDQAVSSSSGTLAVLETNIDDMNPQVYGSVSELLLAGGALDVWMTPIQMKKGRPGVMLSVLVPIALEAALADLILRHTTTLGVRSQRLAMRYEARRAMAQVQTPWGLVAVKLKWVGNDLVGATPEHGDCLTLAKAHNIPLKRVLDTAQAAALLLLPDPPETPETPDPPATPEFPKVSKEVSPETSLGQSHGSSHAHHHDHPHSHPHTHDHPHTHGPHKHS